MSGTCNISMIESSFVIRNEMQLASQEFESQVGSSKQSKAKAKAIIYRGTSKNKGRHFIRAAVSPIPIDFFLHF